MASKFLNKKRELRDGPAKLQWALAMIDSEKVIRMSVRGVQSTCLCPHSEVCEICYSFVPIQFKIVGTYDEALVGRENFFFWALMTAIDTHPSFPRIEIGWKGGFPNLVDAEHRGVDFIVGEFAPGKGGWVAPTGRMDKHYETLRAFARDIE